MTNNDGKRMEIPDAVPAAAAQLMTACWAHEAKDRPTMDAVVATIRPLRPDTD